MSDLQLLAPELIWGLFPRLIGLVFLVSFTSLLPQVSAIAGPNGGFPIELRLRKVREAFPFWRRVVHYPTLLWFSQSNLMLRALVVAGWFGALAAIYGGAFGFWGLLVCYVCYVSLDKAIVLIFPWDCVLFELTLLALFLPAWPALPSLAVTETPTPLLAWAFRLLVFRVMFGFGKAKFAESTKEDLAYLTGFLGNQPLPSPLGWYLHKAPVWVLRGALLVMFVTEIPVPFLIFHSELGVVAAGAIAGLMVAIQLCGSFGYFSLAMLVACVPLLDTVTPAALHFGGLFADGAPVFTHAVVGLHLFGALLAFPFNSWVGQHWHQWSFFERAPRWLSFPLKFYGFFHALRWVHPYGVFPPKTQPGVRIVPVVEVSTDGEHWREVEYPLACTRPESAPRFISPHHARGDQSVIYETFGLNSQSLINGMTSPGDPFVFTNYSGSHALLQRILEGRYYPGVNTKAGSLDPHAPPPKWARIRTFLLKPTTLEEKRTTGAWWKRAYIGPHLPPMQRMEGFWESWLPEPEMWHWEMPGWRRRSHLGKLMQQARAGAPLMPALLSGSKDLDAWDLQRFWDEFLPVLRGYDRKDWSKVREAKLAVEQRFDAATLRKFQRILGRLCVFASGKIDPLYLGRGSKPLLPAKNYARLWMAIQDVIWDGREAFDALLAQPLSLRTRLEASTLEHGMFFTAIFRYDALVFEAQKLRLIRNFVLSHYVRKPGPRSRWEERGAALAEKVTMFPELVEFLKDKFEGAPFDEGYPERYPRYRTDSEGVVQLVEDSVEWEPLPARYPTLNPASRSA